jgi:hypothetical protein
MCKIPYTFPSFMVCGYRNEVIQARIPLNFVPESFQLKILMYNTKPDRLESVLHTAGTG